MMRYVLNMVHHNPGEAPFESAYNDPNHLRAAGFNGQVLKHINCLATLDRMMPDLFAPGSEARAWLDPFEERLAGEIRSAKAAGLEVYAHIDLFLLPKAFVERYRKDLCDPADGKLSLNRPLVLEAHRALFGELALRFPEVDGYMIRVGETYLFDTPFHTGNGAVTYDPDGPSPREKDQFIRLIGFLREEICERLGRRLFFRTWDCFPNRFHADAAYYLNVTDALEPHPKLTFSIKHTALDFWRRVKVNPCIGQGRHPQIVEVQAQREYEGKGAFPNYVMDGVINGFEENARPRGLREMRDHPLFQGVYIWPRGGGWYGPYLKNELWCDLNTRVLTNWTQAPEQGEESAFLAYARDTLGLSAADARRFRKAALLSAKAVLKGRYCEAWDRRLNESLMPTGLWTRDDVIGGLTQLDYIFDDLRAENRTEEALEEKREAVRLWRRIAATLHRIAWPDPALREAVETSAEYGLTLFRLFEASWSLMALWRGRARGEDVPRPILQRAFNRWRRAWTAYRRVGQRPTAATLYRGEYRTMPNEPPKPGLNDTIAEIRRRLSEKR